MEAKERQKLLEQVNKKRSNRTVSATEMILELDSDMFNSQIGKNIKEVLGVLSVEVKEKSIDGLSSHEMNIARFKRKVTCKYDDEIDMYIPQPLEIQEEEQAIVLIEAEKMVDMVFSVDEDIESVTRDQVKHHIALIHRLLGARKRLPIIYMVQGLHLYVKKLANEKNKEMTNRVREMMGQEPTKKRKNNKDQIAAKVDRKQIEDLLIQLQLGYNLKLVHTSSPLDTADWIANFTQDISTIPYKRQKMLLKENFDIGVIKSGTDAKDTFEKSLCQIKMLLHRLASKFLLFIRT